MSLSYARVVPIAVLWPLAALAVTFARFGELPEGGDQLAAAVLGFLLVGILSGLALIALLRRVGGRRGGLFVLGGYVLAAPLGYVFGIAGPLALEAFGTGQLADGVVYLLLFPLAIGLYGSLPPICGAAAGWLVARLTATGDRGPDR